MARAPNDDPLTRRVIGFIAHLRRNGFRLGPRESADALEVVARTARSAPPIRARLKVLLTASRDEWDRFDGLFDAYWFPTISRPLSEFESGATLIQSFTAGVREAGADDLHDGEQEAAEAPKPNGETAGEGGGSGAEALSRVDLADLADPAEIAEAERLAHRLASAIRQRHSRRMRAARRGARLDLRRVIRASLKRGGEPVELRFRKRAKRPVRIVVFVDVSGSMKGYARFFLQFVRGLISRWVDAEAYLIHTRLVPATGALSARNVTEAMARLTEISAGFGGGTQIGTSLRSFNREHARRLNRRTVVMILSDGYDSGPEEVFAAEIARIRQRARRLVWLNPLRGRDGYRPVTLAMLAALEHVDHFAAANTLASLAEIEGDLARL